jgi:hypothetical protein
MIALVALGSACGDNSISFAFLGTDVCPPVINVDGPSPYQLNVTVYNHSDSLVTPTEFSGSFECQNGPDLALCQTPTTASTRSAANGAELPPHSQATVELVPFPDDFINALRPELKWPETPSAALTRLRARLTVATKEGTAILTPEKATTIVICRMCSQCSGL